MRRAVLALLAGGLTLALAGCDWAAFGFDTGNTRYNPNDKKVSVANVANLAPAYAGITGGVLSSSAAVVKDVAYVGSGDGKLYAFDARGITNCDQALKRCNPLWTANLGNTAPGDPTVANGVVYITTPGGLFAFDAAGVTGCSGTPKTCTPLWQRSFGSGGTGNPVVAKGVLYLEKYGTLHAFDAAAGTPLWTGAAGGQNSYRTVAVANGIVYVPAGNLLGVYAFDANGVTGCSGSPKTCVPLWRSSQGGYDATVVGGRLYTDDQYGLYAFDAAGNAPCQGIPKVCSPVLSYVVGSGFSGVPAVANGILYVGHSDGSHPLVSAFDATGSTRCTTASPKVCSPLWQTSTPASLGNLSSPAVANGVVYIGSRTGSATGAVYAFDAAGTSGCTTATPRVCNPLWSSPTNGQVNASVALANDSVFVGAADKSLYVFR